MTGVNRSTQCRRGILRRLAALAVLPLAARPLIRRAMAQEAGPAIVAMTKFAFMPPTIEIKSGGSVIFINRDLVPHTATAGDGSFDTGTLRQNERKEIAFPAAGEFPYICRFHRHMTGIVRVT
jgi:plastocyanin